MTGPPQLVLHLGLHKTGTSSAQHLFWRNKGSLAPHVSLGLLRHLKPAVSLAAAYSRSRNPLLLLDLSEALSDLLAEAPADRHLLVSCEGLSGHLPGWPGVDDYGAAADLAQVVAGTLAERFPDHALSLVYTLRAAEPWLWSAWRHHLIGQRLTQSFEDFANQHRAAADLPAVARAVAEAVAPARVQTLTLEETQAHPLGPGGALLAGLGLPDSLMAELHPVKPGNRGPEAALADRLLALNRSDLPDDEVRARKAMLCDAAGVGGWARGPRAGRRKTSLEGGR